MTDVFKTFLVPESVGALAIKITDAIGYPEMGMFTARMNEEGDAIGYASSGLLRADSPLLQDASTLHAACESDPTVTLADCQELLGVLDLTEDPPSQRIEEVIAEVENGVNASAWVQPTGAHDAYAKGDAVTHSSKTWVSLIDANVWAPGVSGWRQSWGSGGGSGPLPWVQPTGAHDAYALNAEVTHAGKTWRSIYAANVWQPGVFGWTEI